MVPFTPSFGAAAPPAASRSATTSTIVQGPATDPQDFRQIMTPSHYYLIKTCVADLSGIADFTMVESLPDCDGMKIKPAAEKLSVPDSWPSWGAPPDTESDTPLVLSSNGSNKLVFKLSETTTIFGVEVQPAGSGAHTITATYGMTKKDLVRGTISRVPDGDGGALLLAAETSAKKFNKITIKSDAPFAVAQIRVHH
jgi:hypothetical protein